MDNSSTRRVPIFIFPLVVLLLAAMYVYAAYIDAPEPEKTMNEFYSAYFSRDYDTAGQDLSVFWSARFLPQYSSLPASQLMENREKIEEGISKVIAQIDKSNPPAKDMKIEILKNYTQEGDKSAIVVYKFDQKNRMVGMEAALLIKEEDGKFRILNMSPVDTSTLPQIKQVNIQQLDNSVEQLLNS